jgi:Mrr restriction endonuclease-like protein
VEAFAFWGVIAALAVVGTLWGKYQSVASKAQQYDKFRTQDRLISQREFEVTRAEDRLEAESDGFHHEAELREAALVQIAEEKSSGFPWLADAYGEFFELLDLRAASQLETKKHPAPRAAEQVREIAHARRVVEAEARKSRFLLEYYETLFPWLVELRDPNIDDALIQVRSDLESGGREADPARRWLSQAEWRALSSAERSDVALRRYQERHKSNWEIGRDYERFIGYSLEQLGYAVSYQGIIEGFADLGRDVVAVRDGEVRIVQCKYWSQRKQIHEKHVFQLFGTKTAYDIDNAATSVAVLTTSTNLSERAWEFAAALGVVVEEQVSLEAYPLVKCNISKRDGARIYHLPFDQQYDRTVIEPEFGESYVWSAAEAEAKGFRRAYRWHGVDES